MPTSEERTSEKARELGKGLIGSSRAWAIAVVLTYVAILLFTQPADYVDSMNYAKHMVDHYHHVYPPEADVFWDFGHPLLRPLGYLVWSLFRGASFAPFHGNEYFGAASALIILNALGGLAAVYLLFLLVLRVSGKIFIAGLIAIAFAATNAMMNYTQTGTAYPMGIAFQLAGLYLICGQSGRFELTRAIFAGVALGLSICIWFPYVLPIAGILCFASLWGKPDWRARVPFVFQVALGICFTVVICYASIMLAGHVTTLHAAKEWVLRSRYGIEPTRGLLRVIGSIPRGFFWLGTGSTIWKQMLLHGNGNAVSAADLLRSGIWKLCAVYAILFLTFLALLKSREGRKLMISIAVAALPILYFAAFLFDPSPPERYLAVYPLLFCAFGLVLVERRSAWLRAAFAAFLVAMMGVNLHAMSRFGTDRDLAPVVARLNAVNARVGPNDRILVLTSTEGAYRFLEGRPFDVASRNRFLFTPVIEKNNDSIRVWKQGAASAILAAWQAGGHAWLTIQMLASKPKLEWNWVEGDDIRIRWVDIPNFFRTLDVGEPFGGPEGFVEILPSARNHASLAELVKMPPSQPATAP